MRKSNYEELIFDFLSKNRNKRFTVIEIARNLDISYPTCLKHVDVLIAKGKLKVMDFGNAKIVWVE